MRFMSSLAALFLLVGCQEGVIRGDTPMPSVAQSPQAQSISVRDRRVQVTRPSVDVLFVIDDSCSMDAEQVQLTRNFPSFTEYFALSGIDYHIGVVSTDMTNPERSGRLRRAAGLRWIDRDTPNPTSVFSQMARLGTGGSIDESGRAAAYRAIDGLRDTANEGFEREDAELHLLFISDEDDVSQTPTPVEFRRWMETLKPEPEMVRSHALIWQTGTTCAEGYAEGALYEQYAAWTGGIVGDICQSDWTPFLDQLGLQTSGLKTEFFMSDLPSDPDEIGVEVRTVLANGDTVTLRFDVCETCEVQYRPRRNSIVFLDFIPSPQDEVIIVYDRR